MSKYAEQKADQIIPFQPSSADDALRASIAAAIDAACEAQRKACAAALRDIRANAWSMDEAKRAILAARIPEE